MEDNQKTIGIAIPDSFSDTEVDKKRGKFTELIRVVGKEENKNGDY